MANPAQRKVTDDPGSTDGTTDGTPSTEPDEVDPPEAHVDSPEDGTAVEAETAVEDGTAVEAETDAETLVPADGGSPDGDAATDVATEDGAEAESAPAAPVSSTSPGATPAAKVVPPKAKVLPPKAKAKAKAGPQAAPARYTPAAPATGRRGPSPKWVPILMFALWALGLLLIVLNYMGVLPGSGDGGNGWYLVAGLVSILGGIMVATQYR